MDCAREGQHREKAAPGKAASGKASAGGDLRVGGRPRRGKDHAQDEIGVIKVNKFQ